MLKKEMTPVFRGVVLHSIFSLVVVVEFRFASRGGCGARKEGGCGGEQGGHGCRATKGARQWDAAVVLLAFHGQVKSSLRIARRAFFCPGSCKKYPSSFATGGRAGRAPSYPNFFLVSILTTFCFWCGVALVACTAKGYPKEIGASVSYNEYCGSCTKI